jgi:hypothetical protein
MSYNYCNNLLGNYAYGLVSEDYEELEADDEGADEGGNDEETEE